MRTINLIVIHCSATREDKSFTEYDLDVCHRRRGFNGTGYHFYIRKNGDIKSTRPIERIGAHSRGFNKESIGICYEGGLDCKGQPKDTRTEWQKHSLRVLILALLKDYPNCRICGHRDLSPDLNGIRARENLQSHLVAHNLHHLGQLAAYGGQLVITHAFGTQRHGRLGNVFNLGIYLLKCSCCHTAPYLDSFSLTVFSI